MSSRPPSAQARPGRALRALSRPRLVPALLLLAGACSPDPAPPAGSGEASAALPPGTPPVEGVILISCDTLRADHLGLYGHPRPTSPVLDALAAECRVYESAWSTVPITGPALSALFTGRLPEELGMVDNRNLLAAEADTLAEVLAAHGVWTCAVVSNPTLHRREGFPGAGLCQGFLHYDDEVHTPESARSQVPERRAAETTDAALAWLDQRPRERPYFLWVHYQDPHGPYTPPEDCLALLEPTPAPAPGDPAELRLAAGRDERGLGSLPRYQLVDDERRPEVYRQRYEAEIRFFDRELGRLLERLRADGLLERALLVFTADHGESLGEHDYWFCHAQNLHAEELRVPLLLRLPGPADPARHAERVLTPVSHLDLWPTFLAAFGLDPGATRGVNLLAAAPDGERVLPHFLRGAWGLTAGSQRLIVEPGGTRLFDHRTDPAEEHDLAPERPERVRELIAARQAFVERLRPLRLAPAGTQLDAAAERALQALGYGGDGEPGDSGADPGH